MDFLQWLADLLPGHHHEHHTDTADVSASSETHLGTGTLASAHQSALGPGQYDTLAGAGMASPATGDAFLDHLDNQMAGLQADNDNYIAHIEATPTGPSDSGGDQYHVTDSLIESDIAIHSTENDVAAWTDNLSAENDAEASLASDEGL